METTQERIDKLSPTECDICNLSVQMQDLADNFKQCPNCGSIWDSNGALLLNGMTKVFTKED